MNLLGLGLSVGLLASALAAPAPAPTAATAETYTLDNGLRVVLRDDASAPLISVRVLYAWGRRDDPPGKQGTAHLLEHMLFRRTTHLPKTVHAELSRLGASQFNGRTNADYVQLLEVVPVESLSAVLRLESDRMGFPVFDSQELGREKLIVRRERIERLQGNVWAPARAEVLGRLFPPEHPMHPATDATTASISVPQLRRLTATAIAPNNAVLVLSGDLPDNTRDLVDRHFASLRRGALPPRRRHAPPILKQDVRVSISVAAHEPALALLGWHAPHRGEPLAAAAHVTAELLRRRQARRATEQGHASRASTQWFTHHYSTLAYSVFFFGALGEPETGATALAAKLDAALEELEANPPTSQELQSAKKRIEIGMGRQLHSSHMRTEVLAESAAEDVPDVVETILAPVRDVAAQDVQRFVRETLRGSPGRVLVLQSPVGAR